MIDHFALWDCSSNLVSVQVVARTRERAKELATEAFKQCYKDKPEDLEKYLRYIQVECMSEDLTTEYVGSIWDVGEDINDAVNQVGEELVTWYDEQTESSISLSDLKSELEKVFKQGE